MKDISDISFSMAKKLPPAFAGILTDWSTGPREITATIIDLIVRDFVSVSGNNVFLTKKAIGLKPFEEKFLKELFTQRDSIALNEFAKIAYSDKSARLEKIICRAMVDEGFIESDFQKKLAQTIKSAAKEVTQNTVDLNIPKNTKVFVLPAWTWKALALIFTGIVLIIVVTAALGILFNNDLLFFLGFFGLVVTAPILLPVFLIGLFAFLAYYSVVKKAKSIAGGSFQELLLTDRGKDNRQFALELKKFMEKYPMLEDKLHNELVGHAIAFGIGKKWMEKLGQKNAVVYSFLETLESESDKIMKFVDMDSYLKEFQ